MEVRFPHTDKERSAALRLADVVYRNHGYVERLDPLDGDGTIVLVAVDAGVVIGTISIVCASVVPQLPTETYYGFRVKGRYPDHWPERIMEIGRLAVPECVDGQPILNRGAALCGLVVAVQLWGDAHGVEIGTVSLRPYVKRVLGGLGVTTTLIAGPDRLVKEEVPPEYWGYFFPENELMAPSAYGIDLRVTRGPVLTLEPYTTGMVTISPEIAAPAIPAA